ncbi:MAG: hypothetical protein QCI82_08075 [Candidatus Thermoplasmatota archaeon]|nr:hypothetical protein [Candidatus Thermoplasmatota archaeon]
MNDGITRGSAAAGIMISSIGIYLMFPQISEIGEGVGLGRIPFPLFVLLGLAIGMVSNIAVDRLRKKFTRVLNSIAIAYLIWMVIGFISALTASEGGIGDRIQNDRVLGLWFSTFYSIVAMLPGIFGGYALISGSKAGMSVTIGSMMLIPLVSMIYSEARYNLLLDQGVIPSMITVWGLVLFVEAMGLMRRCKELEDCIMPSSIVTRNVLFLLVFSAFSSVLAVAPFLFPSDVGSVYELGTIYGKAAAGLVLLLPLGILALIRRSV